MSKYILVVDLPDDSKCEGCPFHRYPNEVFGICDHLNRLLELHSQAFDCPLIPVDKVMDRLYGLCQSQGDAGYRAVGILQDELGVTE